MLALPPRSRAPWESGHSIWEPPVSQVWDGEERLGAELTPGSHQHQVGGAVGPGPSPNAGLGCV